MQEYANTLNRNIGWKRNKGPSLLRVHAVYILYEHIYFTEYIGQVAVMKFQILILNLILNYTDKYI